MLPKAKPSTLKESLTSILVSGNWGFGQTAFRYATQIVIEKAIAQNVAVGSLVQAHHTGRIGCYVELAASEDLIAFVWAGGYGALTPAAVPYQSNRNRLSLQ